MELKALSGLYLEGCDKAKMLGWDTDCVCIVESTIADLTTLEALCIKVQYVLSKYCSRAQSPTEEQTDKIWHLLNHLKGNSGFTQPGSNLLQFRAIKKIPYFVC